MAALRRRHDVSLALKHRRGVSNDPYRRRELRRRTRPATEEPTVASKSSSKKAGSKSAANAAALTDILDFQRAGMPSADSVREVREVRPPAGVALTSKAGAEAAGGFSLRIIRTNEVDGYEEGALSFGLLAAAAKKPAKKAAKKGAGGDNFSGTARKAAKLSISAAPTKTYKDVQSLINTLPSHQEMVNLRIPTGATSGRVPQEERNVRIKCFLYAASRENDNDFHLILGRALSAQPERYMTMELSGLPPASAPSFAKLKAARDAYKAFFARDMPGTSYDFYDPPIPVEIEGSLFWDASHATGTRPGPQSLKSRMPTVFEVHPISKITFNP